MSISDKILESSIKGLVINHVFRECNNISPTDNEFIINEFSIANFTRRVDLVLAKNDKLFAFEVKSDFDSLIRLKGQVDEYLEHFDKVTVVAASRHIDKALQITPRNVAIWEVMGNNLKIRRKGKVIPITDKFKFIKMMTLLELLNLAKRMGVEVKDKRRRMVEISLLNISAKTLKKEAIDKLKNRYKKRGGNYYDAQNFRNYISESNSSEPRKKVLVKNSIDSFIHAIEKL